MWKYFTTLAGAIVVTLGTVALMMFAILLPYWYHFEDKYPRTDVGLFHECFNEGLNKGCHAFADNAGMEYHYCQANYAAKYQVTVLICLLIPLIL